MGTNLNKWISSFIWKVYFHKIADVTKRSNVELEYQRTFPQKGEGTNIPSNKYVYETAFTERVVHLIVRM